jgi:Rad3-related DNA helicase
MSLPRNPVAPCDVPGDEVLPQHIEAFRGAQWDATSRVLDAWNDGAKVVFLEAPTGVGKTIIAELSRRYWGAKRTAYLCTTKSLQDQFKGDFEYAHVLRGRRNFPTADHELQFPMLNAGDCFREEETFPACSGCVEGEDRKAGEAISHCLLCHPMSACPYTAAKVKAYASPLVCMNTAYFLVENRYVGGLTTIRGARGEEARPNPFDLVILDECDSVEGALLSFESVVVTAKMRRAMGMSSPDRKTVEASWKDWVREEALPRARTYVEGLGKPKPDTIRHHRAATQTLEDLRRLAAGLEGGGWVYESETGKMPDARRPIVFKPVRVDKVAPGALWKHGKKWLCMSATIISPDELAEGLGLERDDWASVAVDSAFGKERRPVVVKPIADMTLKNKEEAWPVVANAIRGLLVRYPRENVLVHTVSYELTRYLEEKLGVVCKAQGRSLLAYLDPSQREEMLASFKIAGWGGKGAVMLAASFDRGIDLPAEECRVVVVAKCPFPYLGDKQVRARLHSKGGQLWYDTQTIRSLVQMTGRGMRSADDWCVSVILDKQFMKIWKEKRRLLPR